MSTELLGQKVTQVELPVPSERDNTSVDNGVDENDYYYPENEPSFYDIIVGDQPDQKVPDSFYTEWEAEIASGTYAGIYIDNDTMAALFSILYGQGGYFKLVGAARAGEYGNSRVSADLAANASEKAQRQIMEIVGILNPLLEASGVPWDKRRQKTDEIVLELQKSFSGKENQTKRKEMQLLLGIGRAALRRAS